LSGLWQDAVGVKNNKVRCEMHKSAILTEELVREAIKIVKPAIDQLLASADLAKRSALAVVVLDPINGLSIYNGIFGTVPPSEWERDYAGIANAKASTAYQTHLDTGVGVFLEPHMLHKGHARYQGGVIFHGIAVGVSGIQSYLDEMVAYMIAAACRGLCQRKMVEEVQKGGDDFLK